MSKLRCSIVSGKTVFKLPNLVREYIMDKNSEVLTLKLANENQPRYIWTAGADWNFEDTRLTVDDEFAFEGTIKINR